MVTYSALAGIVILGDATRSKRVRLLPVVSFALMWNNPFEAVPQNVLLVVQGTVGVPPTWIVPQPAGSDPVGVLSKFSEKIVVATGVPVFCVNNRLVLPC